MTILISAVAALFMMPESGTLQRASQDLERCLNEGDAAQGVTSAMMECLGSEYDRQDARLNQAYKMVMARLTAPQKESLRASQRLWIKRRDVNCHRKSKVEAGGSMEHMIHTQCLVDETIERTVWLEKY